MRYRRGTRKDENDLIRSLRREELVGGGDRYDDLQLEAWFASWANVGPTKAADIRRASCLVPAYTALRLYAGGGDALVFKQATRGKPARYVRKWDFFLDVAGLGTILLSLFGLFLIVLPVLARDVTLGGSRAYLQAFLTALGTGFVVACSPLTKPMINRSLFLRLQKGQEARYDEVNAASAPLPKSAAVKGPVVPTLPA